MRAETVLHHWGNWLANTTLSQWLQAQLWVVPTSQSIHIVALSVVFGAAVVLSLRILRRTSTGRSLSSLVRALVPAMYAGLAVCLLTGIVQTVAEPLRQFVTPVFWLKMLMIAVALGITHRFANSVRRNPQQWDDAKTRPRSASAFAMLSLALWVGIVICGRLIGYTWTYYA